MSFAARRTLFLVAAAAAASFAASRVLADEGTPPAPAAPAAEENEATKSVRAAFTKFQEAAKAVGESDKTKRREASAAASKAQEEFTKAFVASDWSQFDPAKDAQLLTSGLQSAGIKGLNTEDHKAAVRAFETLIAKFPETTAVNGQYLAMAHIMAGDLDKARAALTVSVDKADEKVKAGLQVQLGDVLAAQGDMPAAQQLWQGVLSSVPADADPRRDPRGSARSDADTRVSLVGKPAPEIDSKTWIGGEAKALSAHKGSVVVVDFWATWCPPCRKGMPALDKFAEEHKKDGLVVLGVTRFYEGYPGFMPKPGTADPRGDGEKVDGLTAENLVEHLTQFKANVGIKYPFVVTAGAEEAKAYRVNAIPTMAVIDREGKVAFLSVVASPTHEGLMHATVNRLLAPTPK